MITNQLSFFQPEPALTTSPSTDKPKLPKGWQWMNLGDLGTWSGGGTPSKANHSFWQNGTVLWVSPKDMKSMYIHDTEDKITSEAVANSSTKYVDAPSLLFVTRSGILRRVLPVAITLQQVTVNQDIKTLSLAADILPQYVYYYIVLNNQQILANCSKAGTTVESIEPNLLKQVKIPLPPLAEQQLIVAKIEELFSEIDAGVQEVETALRRLKTYRQAVLHRFLNNSDWERARLGDFKTFSMYGPRFSKDDYSRDGIVVLRTTDIDSRGKVDTVRAPKLNISDKEFEKYKCRKGDILITRTGSIGTYTIFNDDIKAIPGAFLIQYRVDERLSLKFLFYCLANPTTQRHFLDSSAGVGRPNLNVPSIDALPLFVPDLATQIRVVQEIEARLSQADMLETTLRAELQRAERLRQSVLKQAFTGTFLKADVPASSVA
ncbi:restriction endonuclease subunit S [Fibrella aquatilis]|uniref:Restriction endonuclease subunit S n=1 Tax=Fibrella aquatilis TaxID=2817059 RepID=A0A939G623_9BACT|nr:restriction endonuclease subunit S [Fibrella aquatilis]MBO0931873.1 restriction endonuclease subunit S [Fibrella aquatilis]